MESTSPLEPHVDASESKPLSKPTSAKRRTVRERLMSPGALLLAIVAYATSYMMLITPYPPKIEPIRADFQREPWYFERGYLESVAEAFYAPAHYLDVLIRPDYWKK